MNYMRSLTFVFLTFSIASCSHIAPSIDSDVLVKLERTACYGECPIYTVAVKKNGEVQYEGHDYVSVSGTRTAILSKESVTLIESELIRSKFIKMKSKHHSGSWGCFMSATDSSYIIIEGSIKNKRKAVSTYTGCDSDQVNAVIKLANYIDKIAETSKWVEKNATQNP